MLTQVYRRIGTAAVLIPVAAVGLTAVPAAADDEPSTPTATNVIVLISDGAGYNQFDAASLYEAGQSRYQMSVDPATGAIEHLPGAATQVYESYPVQVGHAHFSANGRASYVTEDAWGDFSWVASGATDSAAAATALGTGVKTNNGILGFDPEGNRLLTVGEQALAVGKKVGLVTDVPFNHATPAGFIAHNASRNDYQGLATEMIDSGVDVLIGGGHPYFTDDSTSRAPNYTWISQVDFERLRDGQTDFTYVERRADLEAVAAGTTVPEKLFGLAQVAETFQYNRSGLANRDVLPGTDPRNDVASLATAAQAALTVLSQDEDGFFLMVEAGAVDWAGHANQTTRVIEEQLEFNRTVETVDAWVEANSSWDETLVIITGDHETGYLAGPGAKPTWTPLTGVAGELPQVSWHSGGHTNAVIPLFAKGVGSERLLAHADEWDLVRGAYLDNTEIGQTIFDVLGQAPATGDGAIALEAGVPLGSTTGALSLAVDAGAPIVFDGERGVLSAALPQVTVVDTRSEVQARGKGWTVSGVARDFTAGNRSFGADRLQWAPAVIESAGATPGAIATLEAPVTLADADRTGRVGSTVLGADLLLEVPQDAAAGRYGSEITLTLFAQD